MPPRRFHVFKPSLRKVEGRTSQCLPRYPPLQAPQDPYQGYVVQDEPKGCCSLREVIAHLSGDQLSLGDQFSSIKASLVPREGRGAGQDNEEAEPQPVTVKLFLPPSDPLGAGLEARG